MNMRIGGLASGMDIDSLVAKLMSAEKVPYNKLSQQKQKTEWKKDAYRDVNKNLAEFDRFLFNEMTMSSNLQKKSVISTNSAVTAVSINSKNGDTLSIDSVSKLARSGNAKSTINKAGEVDGSTKLSDLNIGSESVRMQVLQEDGKMKEINLEFNSEDTIDSVISKLKKDTGLNAFYDKDSKQIAISTKATGVSKESFTGKNGNNEVVSEKTSVFVEEGMEFFNKLGFGDSQFLAKGQNAELTVNGATIERQSNEFELEGLKITLNNTYDGSGSPIQLKTKVDSDNMVNKVKDFVEKYNALIDSLNSLTKETKYKDYSPLTDEQKEEMSEKEIESWEKKAKSGILNNDSIVNSVLNKMRNTLYTNGGGKQDTAEENFANTLYELGITTTNSTKDRGKLVIDEDKLRSAIEKDPEQVFKIFSDTTKGNEGLVQKLRKDVNSAVIEIEKKAGRVNSTNQTHELGRLLNEHDKRMENWKRRLQDIEARYWKQFSMMESAINKANQNSSMLFPGQ